MFAGCRRSPPEPPRAARPPPESTVDAGAPVLGAVINARAAIAAGDAVAAFNDANLGLGYAVRLAGADSALYPPPAAPPGYHSGGGQGGYSGGRGGGGHGGGGSGHRHGGGGAGASTAAAPAPAATATAPQEAAGVGAPQGAHGGRGGQHGGRANRQGRQSAEGQGGGAGKSAGASVSQAGATPFTSFDAQVRLISALARLQAHDPAGADVELLAVEAAVHPQLKPEYLPLIRADQSLALASAAVSAGRLGELRTQLTAAQAALQGYQGAPHAAEARALAASIGESLRRPGGLAALAPAQINLWAGVVGAWTSVGTSVGTVVGT
ncbi:MAG TPA: hypothetical protein VHS81_02345 [Caulobacteraceae bacterium]|nr:hypothetical protein [Caulobacteraceae bacterium]